MMDNIEQILNDISKDIFKPSVSVKFKINELEQVVISVNGTSHLNHLKQRVTKKNESKKLIDSIRRNSTETRYVELIIDYLSNITGSTTNWNSYINVSVDIDETIVKKAENELKDHITSIKEIYLEPIEEEISKLNIDKTTLNNIWKEYILPQYNVIEKIDSFRSYSKINKSDEYPYLILSSKTGRILLTQESTGHFLKVENINSELDKIKETENIINKVGCNFKIFSTIKDYLEINEIKYLSKIENSNEAREYGSKQDCKLFYSNRRNSYIKINLIEGYLELKNKKYLLRDIKDNIKDIYKEIDETFEIILNEVIEFLKDKIESRNKKYNKPYINEILTLIDEFPLKGITTYVSILSGEKNSKITSNDYDKSSSYESMSKYTKTFITNKIKEFIRDGLIQEGHYRASFGSYIGLSLSKDSKIYVENINADITMIEIKEDENIDSINALLSKLRTMTSIKAKALLVNLQDKEMSINKNDINDLLKFIEKDRFIYRDYEEFFVKSISKIISAKYSPIFLLNANMTTGVTKKTLKSIYENME